MKFQSITKVFLKNLLLHEKFIYRSTACSILLTFIIIDKIITETNKKQITLDLYSSVW